MNLETTRRQVRQQTRAFYINVKRDVARTRARAQAIKSTQAALDAAQTGYEVGTRNVVDVLIAQRAVYSALGITPIRSSISSRRDRAEAADGHAHPWGYAHAESVAHGPRPGPRQHPEHARALNAPELRCGQPPHHS
jgi:hypothetical protein